MDNNIIPIGFIFEPLKPEYMVLLSVLGHYRSNTRPLVVNSCHGPTARNTTTGSTLANQDFEGTCIPKYSTIICPCDSDERDKIPIVFGVSAQVLLFLLRAFPTWCKPAYLLLPISYSAFLYKDLSFAYPLHRPRLIPVTTLSPI